MTSTSSSASKVECKIAPAAADIEDPQPRFEMQLGCDQPELISLRLLEGLIVIEEVGARVVHSLVEEQLVEVVAQIVVMGNVLLCLADGFACWKRLNPRDTARSTFCKG